MKDFRGVFKWVVRMWQRLQIGHRSMYSVERLYALDDYSRNVSRTRMLAVCLLTPLPALLLVVVLELIPLQNPNAGWSNNSGAWLRFGVISFTVALGLTVQMKGMMIGVSITPWKLVAVTVATSICHVCITLAMGSLWVFPVPFCFVLTIPPFVCCMTLFLFVAVGREAIAHASNLKHQLQSLLVIVSQGNIAIFYTGLSAVFALLPNHGQILFMVLLPFIKLAFKNLVASASAYLEEYVSGIVVFSVDLAHSLFVAACMQTAKSPLALVVIISFDALTLTLALRNNFRSTRTVQRLLSTRSNNDELGLPKWRPELVATVKQLCQNPKVVTCDAFAASNVRLRSPLNVRLSTDNQRALDKGIAFKNAENPTTTSSIRQQQTALTEVQHSFRSFRIAPLKAASMVESQSKMPIIKVSPTHPMAKAEAATISSVTTVEEQVKLVREIAQMMFHCEYIVLIEYVECVIPMVYGLYLQALYHVGGGAHEYYPQTRGLTTEKLNSVVGNLVVYVLLEVLSLVALYIVIERQFGLSIFRQLAFVLETHAIQVQARMFVWIAFILTFTLEHFGSDFTFQFKWMQNKGN